MHTSKDAKHFCRHMHMQHTHIKVNWYVNTPKIRTRFYKLVYLIHFPLLGFKNVPCHFPFKQFLLRGIEVWFGNYVKLHLVRTLQPYTQTLSFRIFFFRTCYPEKKYYSYHSFWIVIPFFTIRQTIAHTTQTIYVLFRHNKYCTFNLNSHHDGLDVLFHLSKH